MLVTDSQYNAAESKSEEKKASLWSKILLSLTTEDEKEPSSIKNAVEKGEIYRLC